MGGCFSVKNPVFVGSGQIKTKLSFGQGIGNSRVPTPNDASLRGLHFSAQLLGIGGSSLAFSNRMDSFFR